MTSCTLSDCGKSLYGRGYCRPHYMRWYRTGSPISTVLPFPARFWVQVEKTDTCWRWTGHHNSYGYGIYGKPRRRAHVLAYELLVGPVPEGKHLDHLCRVRDCVRPDHLEPVSPGENVLRGESPAARNARKTHCLRGHELTSDNVSIIQGWRRCKACHRLRQNTLDARRREAAAV